MYRRLRATKDCYIADKLVKQTRRTRANTGQAGTLDLFKLYGVTKTGSSDVTELSRALIKFDLDPLRALTGSVLDVSHTSFKCLLSLSDVYGGQPTLSNYTLEVAPVSRSWDEGIGSDIVFFNDIDSCNFLTSSHSSGVASLWYASGANKSGLLGSSDIDFIVSGNLHDGQSVTSVLTASQVFSAGTEDMLIDVTRIVSATIKGLLPDEGFRVSFAPTHENDTSTYFVKRFASRHSADRWLRPRLIVEYDESIRDDEINSFFDLTNTVFLYNYDRDGLANLTSGSTTTEVTGANSLVMRLTTDSPSVGVSGGQYNLVVTASQHTIGTMNVTGVYSASFSILSTNSELSPRLAISNSIEFTQIWGSTDGTVGYLTGERYSISKQDRRFANKAHRDYVIHATNMRNAYVNTETVRVRVFAQSLDDPGGKVTKLPIESKSTIFANAYYSVRSAHGNDVAIPFETTNHSTKMSTDGDGMYFDLYMADFDPGHLYEVDMLVKDSGVDNVFRNIGTRFRVTEA